MTTRVHVTGLDLPLGAYALIFVRWALLSMAIGALSYTAYVYADASLFQSYQNWAFDEQLHGRSPSVIAYLEDATPLRRLFRRDVVIAEK